MLEKSVRYDRDRNAIEILDQTLLPNSKEFLKLTRIEEVHEAISSLRVRGAPAIGVVAAWGIVMHMVNICGEQANVDIYTQFNASISYLAGSRPTAVNLFWALQRIKRCFTDCVDERIDRIMLKETLLAEAQAIQDENDACCVAIGEHGLSLLTPGMSLLTHCNAGAIATASIGTTLAPVFIGQQRGYNFKVFASETRPLLQGARLTTWELMQAGVDVTLICDSMVAHLFSHRRIDAVIVGSDRIAANGDTANKIGTHSHAILAKAFGIPLYVFGPSSTIDPDTPSGSGIVIEERPSAEVTRYAGVNIAPNGVKVFNPAFDVTPAKLISAIITERGIFKYPYDFRKN